MDKFLYDVHKITSLAALGCSAWLSLANANMEAIYGILLAIYLCLRGNDFNQGESS